MIDFSHCFITLGFLVSFCWFPLYLKFHLIWVPVLLSHSLCMFASDSHPNSRHTIYIYKQRTFSIFFFSSVSPISIMLWRNHVYRWWKKQQRWLSFKQTFELALSHHSTKRWENENLCRVKKIGFVFTSSIFRSQSKWNVPYKRSERKKRKNRQRHKFLQYSQRIWLYGF